MANMNDLKSIVQTNLDLLESISLGQISLSKDQKDWFDSLQAPTHKKPIS